MLGLLELLLVFGAVLGLAVFDLVRLKRDQRRSRSAPEEGKTGDRGD